MNALIHQGHIKLIKSDSKNMYDVAFFISNKCCYFDISNHQKILGKKKS